MYIQHIHTLLYQQQKAYNSDFWEKEGWNIEKVIFIL